jgi:hypothetical protein
VHGDATRDEDWVGSRRTLFDVIILILVEIFILVVNLSLDIDEPVSLLFLLRLQVPSGRPDDQQRSPSHRAG